MNTEVELFKPVRHTMHIFSDFIRCFNPKEIINSGCGSLRLITIENRENAPIKMCDIPYFDVESDPIGFWINFAKDIPSDDYQIILLDKDGKELYTNFVHKTHSFVSEILQLFAQDKKEPVDPPEPSEFHDYNLIALLNDQTIVTHKMQMCTSSHKFLNEFLKKFAHIGKQYYAFALFHEKEICGCYLNKESALVIQKYIEDHEF